MIVIVQGCGSNIASIQFALDRLGKKSVITHDPTVIKHASHVVLPGVGHANHAMKQLQSLGLDKMLVTLEQPVLGICLGMQLLYEGSEEGNVGSLGVIPGIVKQLVPQPSRTIPHMGWNTIHFICQDHSLCLPPALGNHAYFAHSYVAPLNQYSVGTTVHTEEFTSIVQYKNFVGMQFHPERSGLVGEHLLKNFIEMESV